MGQRQSKDELVYQQVNQGNVNSIKALRREGAGLEWTDSKGKTPLIVACMNPELNNVAKALIELGANVNAYRPGPHAGTPLHHAAKRGLEQTVKLLLSHGANALVMNDGCQTTLDVARAKGQANIVRAIEAHICLFSGWLKEIHGSGGFLKLLAPQSLSRKVWVVVVPCGSRNLVEPFKLELAIYACAQDAQPRTIVPLWKAKLEEPKFNKPDPAAILSNVSTIPKHWRKKRAIKSSQETRRKQIKLGPVTESEKQQLQWFCNACKGIPQVARPTLDQFSTSPITPSEDVDLAMAINDSLHSISTAPITAPAASEEVDLAVAIDASLHLASNEKSPALVNPHPGTSSSIQEDLSAPPIAQEKREEGGSCTICLDAPVEAACVPCGHLAGCMSCLNEVKAKEWGGPCAAPISIRPYGFTLFSSACPPTFEMCVFLC